MKRWPNLKQLLEEHPVFVLALLAIGSFAAGTGAVLFIQQTADLQTITRPKLEAYEAQAKKLESAETTHAAAILTIKNANETENAELQKRHGEEIGAKTSRLEQEIGGLRQQLSEATAQLSTYQDRERGEQRETERIKTEGGIYRVPDESTVWLVRGGKRFGVKEESELRRLTGQHSSQALPNSLIMRIPIEK